MTNILAKSIRNTIEKRMLTDGFEPVIDFGIESIRRALKRL